VKISRRQLRKIIREYYYLPSHDIEYTAVILDDYSRQLLLQFVPKGWQSIAHHITLIDPTVQKQGRLPKPFIDIDVSVNMIGIVGDNKVLAGVIDPGDVILPYKGPKFLHVTIATNPETGGKPAMSNNLDLDNIKNIKPITLTGILRETIKERH